MRARTASSLLPSVAFGSAPLYPASMTDLPSGATVTPYQASPGPPRADSTRPPAAAADRRARLPALGGRRDHGVDRARRRRPRADRQDPPVGQQRQIAGPVGVCGDVDPGEAVGAVGLVPRTVGVESVGDEVDL